MQNRGQEAYGVRAKEEEEREMQPEEKQELCKHTAW